MSCLSITALFRDGADQLCLGAGVPFSGSGSRPPPPQLRRPPCGRPVHPLKAIQQGAAPAPPAGNGPPGSASNPPFSANSTASAISGEYLQGVTAADTRLQGSSPLQPGPLPPPLQPGTLLSPSDVLQPLDQQLASRQPCEQQWAMPGQPDAVAGHDIGRRCAPAVGTSFSGGVQELPQQNFAGSWPPRQASKVNLQQQLAAGPLQQLTLTQQLAAGPLHQQNLLQMPAWPPRAMGPPGVPPPQRGALPQAPLLTKLHADGRAAPALEAKALAAAQRQASAEAYLQQQASQAYLQQQQASAEAYLQQQASHAYLQQQLAAGPLHQLNLQQMPAWSRHAMGPQGVPAPQREALLQAHLLARLHAARQAEAALEAEALAAAHRQASAEAYLQQQLAAGPLQQMPAFLLARPQLAPQQSIHLTYG